MEREGDLLVTDDMRPLPVPSTVEATVGTPGQVHLFELREDTEIPVFIEWMDKLLPGVAFDIPPVNSVVIARNGSYDVYLHDSVMLREEKNEGRARTRLSILNITEGSVERARAAEKWVLGTDE